MNHEWPTDPSEHVWGPWMLKRGLPKPVSYRQCVHPGCNAVEEKDATQA